MPARTVNKVILVGRLGRDAETKFTPSGVAKTTFSLATNRRWKDTQTGEWKEETDWHNIVLWRSEKLAEYLTKGKMVYVEGRLHPQTYEKDGEKRYKVDVVGDEVILLGGDKQGEDAPPKTKQQRTSSDRTGSVVVMDQTGPHVIDPPADDDDVPF